MKRGAKAITRDKARPKFFRTPASLRRWFERHHATAGELVIGFYKKSAARRGIAYAEALDEALCFGWIDGVRWSLDETRYMIRFTPRKPKSNWSLVNTRRFRQLAKLDVVAPAGCAAFERRDPAKTAEYSYENRSRRLAPRYEKRLRENPKAWRFFAAQPPSYRRLAALWIMSAKREETRGRRLAALVADSAAGRRAGFVTGKKST